MNTFHRIFINIVIDTVLIFDNQYKQFRIALMNDTLIIVIELQKLFEFKDFYTNYYITK